MKAKLIFDVPEERKAFMAAVKATDMAIALWDIVYNLGKEMNNYYDGMKDEEYEKVTAVEAVMTYREKIIRVLDENGINVDDLVE